MICARLVGPAAGWTTSQLAARLLREVHAVDPDHTRRSYEKAVRERAVHGYLDHIGTAVLSGSGLPAAEAAAAAVRLEALADALRAAGYPATVQQTRADVFVRLLDGTLDGQTHHQILSTMLALGPIAAANPGPDTDHGNPGSAGSAPGGTDPDAGRPQRGQPAQPSVGLAGPAEPARPAAGGPQGRGMRYGIEVRLGLATLLGLDEHPAELPGWGPIPATAARDLVAAQHAAEWRVAIVDADGYLAHGDLIRRRPRTAAGGGPGGRGECRGGIVEIAVPVVMLDQLPALAAEHPDWAQVLHGIVGSWQYREAAIATLDAHPDRRFAHAALRRHIHLRDRYCVGVGCRRRAAAADLDHTREHARGGPTVTTNSGPCCGRHHTLKHQTGWTLQQPEPGRFTWTSPLGQKYDTRGGPIIPDLPEALLRHHQPHPADTAVPLMLDGPILHRPEPAPPPPARPPPAEQPDEPPF